MRYKFTVKSTKEVYYVESANPQSYKVFQAFCKRHGLTENEVDFEVE